MPTVGFLCEVGVSGARGKHACKAARAARVSYRLRGVVGLLGPDEDRLRGVVGLLGPDGDLLGPDSLLGPCLFYLEPCNFLYYGLG